MNNNVFTMIPGQNSLPLGKTEQNKFWSQKCVICDSFVTRHTKTSTLENRVDSENIPMSIIQSESYCFVHF